MWTTPTSLIVVRFASRDFARGAVFNYVKDVRNALRPNVKRRLHQPSI